MPLISSISAPVTSFSFSMPPMQQPFLQTLEPSMFSVKPIFGNNPSLGIQTSCSSSSTRPILLRQSMTLKIGDEIKFLPTLGCRILEMKEQPMVVEIKKETESVIDYICFNNEILQIHVYNGKITKLDSNEFENERFSIKFIF